ncbi:MAG: rhodanese-like domain-containing protein [Psychromonas sp.]
MSLLKLPSPLVSIDWLENNIDNPNLILLDASWHMASVNRDGQMEWFNERIPGARFFDFNREVCDKHSEFPHMMPNQDDFQDSAQKLGINHNSTIIVYDSIGIFSSPRVWWMFKVMGCENIGVLDGGLPAWKDKSLPVESGSAIAPLLTGDFVANYQSALMCGTNQVIDATQRTEQSIVDARPKGRFDGAEKEPRVGVRSGHIPTSKSLPASTILENNKMKDAYQLALLFEAISPKSQQLIFSCGSGVTACILALGATLAGYEQLCVYDGSITEWSSREDLSVVKSV